MKDNLFEMLLTLFEKSLAQLRNTHESSKTCADELLEDDEQQDDESTLHVKMATYTSTRIFTYAEQNKLTKASYQFLMRMKLWNLLDSEALETIMTQLELSESHIVTLEETKWMIRNVLAPRLTAKQLAFLDLVLAQPEKAVALH